MAGDWIKVEHTLPDKPEVIRLADILGIDQDSVVGKLIRFWIWVDSQSINGDALSVTETSLDRITNCNGFVTAMVAVGWLVRSEGHYAIPNFERHNTQTAKARALTKTRMQRSRYARSVTGASPEKRRDREEKSTNTPYSPPRGTTRENGKHGYSPEFEEFWAAYPAVRKTAKAKAWEAWLKAIRTAQPADLVAAAREYAASPVGSGEFSKQPATWLNGGCWDDDRESWNRLPSDRKETASQEIDRLLREGKL